MKIICDYFRKSNSSQGVFLDVSSALENVWHKGLIEKLNQIGVEGKLLDLFKSYLSNRRKIVVVKGVLKYLNKYLCRGTAGELIRSNVFFIIYINDILENLNILISSLA